MGTMLGYVRLMDESYKEVGTITNPLFTSSILSSNIDSILSASGTSATAGDLIVIPATAGKRNVIFALSIFTGTGVNSTLDLTDGPGGTVLFSALVVSTNQSPMSFAEAVTLPAFLFHTSPRNPLVMNLSAATTGVVNLSYYVI